MMRVCEICGMEEINLCHHILTMRGWVVAFEKGGDYYTDVRVRCPGCVTIEFLLELDDKNLHTRYNKMLERAFKS